MISTDYFDAAIRMYLSTELADGDGRLQQVLRRHGAKAANEFRADQVELIFKIAAAICKFVGQRIAISGRPAFDHVEDIDVFPFDPTRFNNLIEQLTAAANERLSQSIFVCSRRFAKKAEAGLRITDAEHGLRPRAG